MKKSIIGFMVGCVFTAITLLGAPALADAYNQTINVQIDKVDVLTAGKENTEPTLLWNNKTYIPLRETLENANCRVTYYKETSKAVVNNRFEQGGDRLSVNGKALDRNNAIYYWASDDTMTFYIDAEYLIENCGVDVAVISETYGKTNLPKVTSTSKPSNTPANTSTTQNATTVPPVSTPAATEPVAPATGVSSKLNTFDEYFIYSDDGKNKYLGKITKNQFDSESIWNEFGEYGNDIDIDTIWCNVGTYGGSVSMYSSSATLATHPPKIYDKNGNFVAYLTENTAKYPSYTKTELAILFTK